MEKQSHPHGGHRQRLKDKIRQNGLNSLSLHEVLEYLLTYTIPRKDTNVLAHELIKRYNGFANVFAADRMDLLSVKGVGEETALFLTSLNVFVDIFMRERGKQEFLPNVQSCVQFFRKSFPLHDNENLYIVCLNKSFKVLKTFSIPGLNDHEIGLDLNQLNQVMSVSNVFSIVVFHTHPNGSCEPSIEDYQTTQQIVNICCMMGIYLSDHIILNETKHFSFGRNNLLADMYQKYHKMFPKQSLDFAALNKLGIKIVEE